MLRFKHYMIAYLFLAPSLVGLLVFVLYPILDSLYLSFTKWDGLTPIKFIGLDNYRDLLTDDTFGISLRNNIYYTAVTVPLTVVISILLALVMNVKVRGIKAFRVLYFFPNITASIAVGIIWAAMFTQYGPINTILRLFGVSDPPIWLASTSLALPAVMMVSIWKSVGYSAVILFAGLQGVPRQLYEAAELDGANRFKQFLHVTLPGLSPVIFFCTVTGIIGSFQVFDTVMAMTQGGPGRSTNVLVYYIYNTAFQNYRFGSASAMSYVLFIIILILTLIQLRVQKRWVTY
ncbi:sugar ABC transporter permease [Paenibacillus sp. MWE-103]|uniref:Sugar ABC transporter permease n=1 Tax=Paenibacillus artemisiicola TaxID=1172618 RepID=A0ABS3WBR3_9BACL|nr:sugar ABC transporter permease [Paenibacillus artemisiicola]MBO7745733.1 sugar ABC transporter permease [Paenibacillus artemisiicola]